MIQARSSNIVRHKPNYAILFCLLVVVGDLGLQIVPIRVKALLSDNNVQNQKPRRPLVPITNNRQPFLINFDDSDDDDNPKEDNNNILGESNGVQNQIPDQPIVSNNNQHNEETVEDDTSIEHEGDNLNDFEVDNSNLQQLQLLENSNENNINGKKNSDPKVGGLVSNDNDLLKSDSDSDSESETTDEPSAESVPEPIEHQLNESASKPKDNQISPKEEPKTDKQLLQENQVFELTTILCQQKKIIENCYKIYNEGSSSGLKYAKQQELKKLVEDADKIQADCNEKVKEFELPEPVGKFREQINSNLDKIKGKLLDKTDLNKEYDQLEPVEMSVPIDYLERSKFWKFFSNHKKALIYGSIGVGVMGAIGAVAGVIGGINHYKNKKLSGQIPEWEIDANEQWPTKPNKSSFTKKLVMILGLIMLMAIILAVVAFFVLKTASKKSSANKQQQPQPPSQPNQPTETPTDTNNANTLTTTGTENVDETGAATGPTPTTPTTTTTSNKTNKSKQSARKSTIKSDKKSARKSRLTKSNKARGEKSKAKSTIQPAKSKGSGIGERRRSQAQPRGSMVAKSTI